MTAVMIAAKRLGMMGEMPPEKITARLLDRAGWQSRYPAGEEEVVVRGDLTITAICLEERARRVTATVWPPTDLLQPSRMKTACAYKGPTSRYWQAPTADGKVSDIAWCYEAPKPEVARIAGLLAFFNERVDAIYVDGKEMQKTRTVWSHS